ncbi:MAG TPA: efflux RND transporter periplasmic adaptor subunit, partial [Planctomycetota bacterium]|nr:efflux RND transporter periplasmic adaptor subunit [Planctomycetota bacterium]
MKRATIFLVAAAPALALLAAGCSDSSASAAAGGGGFQMPPARVSFAAAVARDVPVYLDEIGKCAALEVVSIQPRVGGQITAVQFADGVELKKGDPLFTIDPRPYKARLDEAAAALAQARAEQSLREAEFARVKDMGGSKAISAEDVDARKSAVEVAQARVESAAAALDAAKLDLEWCSIVSPIDGRAGRRLVDVGNIVKANDDRPLLVIQRLDPIYAEFTVTEGDLARVRRSMAAGSVRVEVTPPGGEMRAGELSFLDNTVQEASGTVKLRATVPNPERSLWPGQFVNVRLVLETRKDAVLAPSAAAQIGQQGPFVYVLRAPEA